MSTYLLPTYVIIYNNIHYPLYHVKLKFIKTYRWVPETCWVALKKARLQLISEESYYLIIKLIGNSS